MKGKKAIGAFLILVLAVLLKPGYGLADGNKSIEPNKYQKKDIELNTDYFNEESLLEEKSQLPEEQKMLTFKRDKQLFFQEVKTKLFMSSGDKSTAARVKAQQLNLFSGDRVQQSSQLQQHDKKGGGRLSIYMPLTLGIILALCLLYMFFVLVPKINKEIKN